MVQKALLSCGILAALIYVGSDIIAAMRWEGYSYAAQSVSELRAVGAPTRSFLMPILFIYTLLEIAFGYGVWKVAAFNGHPKRSLRIAGALLIALGVLELAMPFLQLNLNEEVDSLTNRLHLAATVVTVLLLLLIIGFGAMADGRWFRLYSYATIALFFATGVWSFMEVPRIEANLSTPWLGIRERLGIYGYMLWLLVFAIVLWRSHEAAAQSKPPAGIGSPHLAPR